MGKINSRQKGIRGERQVIDMLQPIIDSTINKNRDPRNKVVLQRNTLQSDSGGYDIVGIPWIAFEVKNCESGNVSDWWQQCWNQATADQTAVLLYKRNRTQFRVRMKGCVGDGWVRVEACVDISLNAFLKWFEASMKAWATFEEDEQSKS